MTSLAHLIPTVSPNLNDRSSGQEGDWSGYAEARPLLPPNQRAVSLAELAKFESAYYQALGFFEMVQKDLARETDSWQARRLAASLAWKLEEMRTAGRAWDRAKCANR